jgi:cellulose biosynthesis protein BcsQ
MSRFLDQVRHAATQRPRPRSVSERGARPFRVLTVANNKGGVGKTTVATNLAVYLRALREDLPVLILGFDEQSMLDRMFTLDPSSPGETVATGLRVGAFTSVARLGQYGVHYVPSSSDISELKREIVGPYHLEAVLRQTNWQGLVIVDTKSDFEILTQNAIAASDLTVVVVKDGASLAEAQKVFDQLTEWNQPRERARILLSLMDLRVKYQNGEKRDIMALLLSQIRRRGYPLFDGFISRSRSHPSRGAELDRPPPDAPSR